MCKQCGAEFHIKTLRLKDPTRGTFCSVSCSHKFHSKENHWAFGKKRLDIAGENNPVWKGGLPKCVRCGKDLSLRHGITGMCQNCYLTNNHSNLGRPRPDIAGENNHKWVGDAVSYRALHQWVSGILGTPSKCEHCGEDGLSGHKIQWANISGLYLRNTDDWIRLCPRCHKAYDTKKKVEVVSYA